jgi:hypothetical protein
MVGEGILGGIVGVAKRSGIESVSFLESRKEDDIGGVNGYCCMAARWSVQSVSRSGVGLGNSSLRVG